MPPKLPLPLPPQPPILPELPLPIHRKIIEMPQHEAFVFVLLFSSDSSDIGCCTLGLKRQVWWDSSQPCCQKHCSTMTTRLFENNIWHISIPAPFLNLQIACLSRSSLLLLWHSNWRHLRTCSFYFSSVCVIWKINWIEKIALSVLQ